MGNVQCAMKRWAHPQDAERCVAPHFRDNSGNGIAWLADPGKDLSVSCKGDQE